MSIDVLFDHQIFSAQEHGGISRYFVELASRLTALPGFSARIVAPVSVNAYLRDGTAPHWGVTVPYSSGPLATRARSAVNRLLVPIITAAARPTIVHETYYSPTPSARGGAARVVTVYDMIQERFSSMFPAQDRTSLYKRATVERADLLICISESTRRDLITLFGVPEDRTRVVLLGFTLSKSAATDAALDATGQRQGLLYVGSRAPYKNFGRLLAAYAASAMLRGAGPLVAFGGGAATPAELELIRSMGLKEGEVLFESGGDEYLARRYRSALAFVYPSLYEGFGIPPLEAMQFDCPVVCSNTSSIPEVVGDAGEYFDPEDPDSMRLAIERVLASSSLSATLAARGRSRLSMFSWQRTAEQTAALYKEVLGS